MITTFASGWKLLSINWNSSFASIDTPISASAQLAPHGITKSPRELSLYSVN